MEIISGEEAADLALDSHYQDWDSEGREESDLPQRIIPFGPYKLIDLPLDKIPDESPYEIDEDKIETLTKTNPQEWEPIIAPFSPQEEIADGWHRALAAKTLNLPTIKAYTPIKAIL